jgi:dTDP-4-dehydrorhamnose 3,5-epimerase
MPVRLVTTRRFADARGWFSETFNARRFAAAGIAAEFVQDNHSLSRPAGTLRGLHFQRAPHAQAKLVRCLRGRIYDVAVDLRRESPTFRRWVGAELSDAGGEQLFVPAGFGHAFLTLEPDCEVAYKVDAYYAPEADGGIAWNDPALAVDWPLGGGEPVLSDKDAALPMMAQAAFDFPYDGRPLAPLTLETA